MSKQEFVETTKSEYFFVMVEKDWSRIIIFIYKLFRPFQEPFRSERVGIRMFTTQHTVPLIIFCDNSKLHAALKTN